jgi:hypothetical protein
MNNPILVLQYPDPYDCKTVVIAVTRNSMALYAFKKAVLEEARLAVMDWESDEVLCIQNQIELQRLEKLLEKLIPDSNNLD